MLKKLNKYKDTVNTPLVNLSVVLDPATMNVEERIAKLEGLVPNRQTIDNGCENNSNAYAAQDQPRPLTLLDRATCRHFFSKNVGANAGFQFPAQDEVNLFFEITWQVDDSFADSIDRWRAIGSKQFPDIAQLACDTLMSNEPSVPSECAFSDSGDSVRADRSRLVDKNIKIMMELGS